jgi:hypothetical protein
MQQRWTRWAASLLAGACLLFTLQACSSYKPFQYHDERESLPGPGLFSGEDGEFILFRMGQL